MKKVTFLFSILVLLVAFSKSEVVFAQTVTAGQTAGGILQQQGLRKKTLTLRERIESEKPKETEVKSEDTALNEEGAKALVSTIQVEGVTLLPQTEISKVTSQYEGQQLTLRGMQKVADLITDEYRSKGYATSRAYIPPQTIKNGLLIIRVVEGKLGSIQFRGNRYFKTSRLRDKIALKPNGYFDYSALQKSLVYINQHPDRQAKAVLAPGAEPGTTDVIIDVADNYPFHATFQYDNYGSRYINKYRYATIFEHNNLLGFDDRLYLKALYSDGLNLTLQQGMYTFPVTETLDVGAYALFSRTDLGDELDAIDASGKATLYGVFANKALIQTNTLDLRLNLGFDYKKINNYIGGVQSSRDEMRVFKVGFDYDKLDKWGRNILTAEMDFGVPDLLNGMANKDPNCSRVGAGATFQKSYFNFFRLQPMPFHTSLLLKNTFQYTNHNLVASEQFQIGGPTSVRGYPVAEYSGDKGFYSAVEWSFPIYGLSKYMKVPFRQESLYDSLRLVCFYDIGFVNNKTLGAGESENQTLKGWGVGARLNVSDDMSLRVEVGYPAGKTPSDSDHAHPWIEFILKF